MINRVSQVVHVTLPNGTIRTAKYLGSQGCVTLPFSEVAVHFTPVAVKSQLLDSTTEPWPMGDVLPKEALPAEIDAARNVSQSLGRGKCSAYGCAFLIHVNVY